MLFQPLSLSPLRFLLGIAGVLACLFLLSGCFGKEDASQTQYTFGPMEAEGVLTSTGISLMRRGTHVLSVDGFSSVYLESPKLSLRDFDGKNVKVSGVLEQNVRKEFLPVLIVSAVTLLSADSDLKEVSVPAFSMTLDLPVSWTSSLTTNGFTATLPGAPDPLLTVTHEVLSEREEPLGIPLRVGGRSAVRVDAQDGVTREVFIRDDSSWILFTFTVSDNNKSLEERFAEFSTLLSSVRFGAPAVSSTSSSAVPLSGTGALPPQCGGPAGILCPSGYYCSITNATENIGFCTPVRR